MTRLDHKIDKMEMAHLISVGDIGIQRLLHVLHRLHLIQQLLAEEGE